MELKRSLEVSAQPIKYHTTLSTRSLRVTIGSSTEPTLLSSPQEAPAPKLTKVVAGVALAQALGQARHLATDHLIFAHKTIIWEAEVKIC